MLGGDRNLDERLYANAVADRCGFAGQQVALDVEDIDIRRSDAFAVLAWKRGVSCTEALRLSIRRPFRRT